MLIVDEAGGPCVRSPVHLAAMRVRVVTDTLIATATVFAGHEHANGPFVRTPKPPTLDRAVVIP
jgi:hypothetical protein